MGLLEQAEERRGLAPRRMAKARPATAIAIALASLLALALALSRTQPARRSRFMGAPNELIQEQELLPGFEVPHTSAPPVGTPVQETPLPGEGGNGTAVPGHGETSLPGEGHGEGEPGHEGAEEPGHGEGEEGDEEEHHGYLALFFLFGGFGVGCILQVIQDRYLPFIPYTCLLFLTGVGLAMLHFYRPPTHWTCWQAWYHSVDMWEHISPHVVLNVFLPPLVFSEAMRLNIKLGMRLFGQVMLLACPGVIIGTVLTAAFSHYIFPYGWGWPVSLVFGSILAATDPVAVVALFNTLGVSPRLTMIISGESLLNDGTAIVLFNLMMKAWKAQYDEDDEGVSWLFAAKYFVQMTVPSVFLGFGVAAVGLVIIFGSAETRFHSDAMIQVAVTVCVGFLSFFLAENEVETSGVLTVVSAGVLFSYLAWPRFVSKETMRTCWEFIEFLGNTVIFLLAGLLFGDNVLKSKTKSHLHWSDCFWLLALYFAATLIRFIMIGSLWPLLNCCGEKVNWKEVVVMTWSGLRGAVGLVLAISVDRGITSVAKADPKVGSLVMFHVGGMAMLTILVNATLCGPLLSKLGFTKTEDIEEKCIEHFERVTDATAHMAAQEILESKDPDPRFVGARLETTADLVPVLSSGPPEQEIPTSQLKAKLRMYREVFMRAVQHHYWMDIEQGLIPRTSRVARILLYSTDAELDDPSLTLRDWETIEETLDGHQVVPCLSNLVSAWPLSKISLLTEMFPAKSLIETWQVYAALSMIEAHKAAQTDVPQNYSVDGVLGYQVQATVQQESQAQIAQAVNLLQHMHRDVVETVKSRMLAGKLLQLQVEKVTQLQESGMLSEKGAGHIMHRIMDAQRNVSLKSSLKSISFFDGSPCGGDDSGESTSDSEVLLNSNHY
mmetsp:Transcript_95859/g.280191  ORF Transcript_95859/g.280191 Transcript_95859/m.280191 type:complete len:891 (-) Transcript_95859:58-2730(-)